MTEQNFQQSVISAVVTLLEPVTRAVGNPIHRDRLLNAIGYDLAAVTGYGQADLDAWLAQVKTAVDGVRALVDGPPNSIDEVKAAMPTVQAAMQVLTTAPPILTSGAVPDLPITQFGEDVLTHLVTTALMENAPVAFQAGVLFGIIVPPEDAVPSEPVPESGPPIRRSMKRAKIDFAMIGALLNDPITALKDIYFPEGMAFGDETDRAARLLLGRIGELCGALGIHSASGLLATFGIDPAMASTELAGITPAGLTLAGHMLSVSGTIKDDVTSVDPNHATFGVDIALSSPDRGGLGLVVVPRGQAKFATPIGKHWVLGVDLSGTGGAFAVGSDGVITQAGDGATVKFGVGLASVPATSGLSFLIGSTTGTRFEVGSLVMGIDATFGVGRPDYGFTANASKVAFVISGGDGDGFLNRILPKEGVHIPLDAGIGWHRRTGWQIGGSVGLDTTLPLHVTLGPITVETLHIAIKASTETGQIDVQIGATAKVAIGPVRGEIDRVGVTAAVKFPARGGNAGPADIEWDFRPPDGLGLVIDASPVTGGGYLFHDPAKGQYAGAVQLAFSGIALKALGLLTTKSADGTPMTARDGSPDWSLLLIISAEFPAMQLGLGFTLSGVGGLIGINRTSAVDALRAGVRDKSLDAVMFPPNPVADAAHVVATLGKLFPVASGQYLFGPMARIGWGTPTILTLDIALILELPSPVRLIVLGRLGLALPRPDAAVVSIHLDAIGVIDFDKGEASIDATIYDSKIAMFALTGDMALRARWGTNPTFALSAGGFHPRYTPPPGFPVLRRLTIALATGNNPRIRLEAYLALTSNTVQFGARVEVYAEAAGFNISGTMYFDALLQMSPFEITVDLGGSVALKRGKSALFSISLDLTLSGPTPWRAKGRASFKILFFSVSLSFDVTIGRGSPPPPPAAIDVRARLDAALADPGNWSTQLPAAGTGVVTLRELAPPPLGELLAHPLGSLQVRQRDVPLGVELAHFGSAPIRGEHRFDITQVTYGSAAAPVSSPLTDLFAPAQYLELSDDEKLTKPSFQPFRTGLQFGTSGAVADPAPPPFQPLSYETLIIDDPDEPARAFPAPKPSGPSKPGEASKPETITGPTVIALADGGLGALAGRHRLNERRFRGPRIPMRVLDVDGVVR